MLKIRLQRTGRKHEPTFRLVLTDSKNSTKSGRFIETLGNYDSRRGEKSEFKADRISYWMSLGAQTSDTVKNLLIDKKIIEGKKVNVLPKKKPIITEKKDQPAQAGEDKPAEAPTPVAEGASPEAPTTEPAPAQEETKSEAPVEEKAPEAPAPQPEEPVKEADLPAQAEEKPAE